MRRNKNSHLGHDGVFQGARVPEGGWGPGRSFGRAWPLGARKGLQTSQLMSLPTRIFPARVSGRLAAAAGVSSYVLLVLMLGA